MVICVSKELNHIKEQLKERGYIVVNNASTLPCDAIICNLKNGELLSLNAQNSVKREGTLIIDCGSKSVDEIEYILNNRVYNTMI